MIERPKAGAISSLAHRLLVRAEANRNVEQLEKLIHDEFRGVETDGLIVSMQQLIEILLGAEFINGQIREDVVINHKGFLIVIGTAVFQTAGPEARYRFTDIVAEGKLICSHVTQLS